MHSRIIIFLLFLSLAGNAQKQGHELIDSLVSIMPAAPNDTVRARILNRITNYYVDVNVDTAFIYAARGMDLSNIMHWKRGLATFHICYGNIFSTRGELDSSLSRYTKALNIFIEENDPVNQAVCYNNLGGIANAKSDFVAAAQYFSKALQIGSSSQNKYTIGLACSNLALVYQLQQDYNKGMYYARQSLAAYESIDDKNMTPMSLSAIATLFLRQKQYDSSYNYYQKALTQCKQNDNKIQEAGLLNSLSQLHSEQKDYVQALKYATDAKKIWDVNGPEFEDAINNTGLIGSCYLKLVESGTGSRKTYLSSAIVYLKEAVEKCNKTNNKASESEFLNALAQANALSGNYKDAYLNNVRYQELKDSIFSQENKNKIAAAIGKLEVDKKNDEIAISKLTIANQQKQRVFYIVGLLFLGITGSLLYRQSRTRKKTNTALMALNNELDQANKVKSTFFSILSHDLRRPVANLISFLHLQQGAPDLLTKETNALHTKRITSSAEHLLANMEELLLWSKGQMEHFKPDKKDIQVSVLFKDIEDNFSDSDKVKFIFTDHQQLIINTDEDYIKTIMRNLTANAVKALDDISGAAIEWKAWEANGRQYLSIKDNGKGITEGQSSILSREESTIGIKNGLGLYLVRDMAKAIQSTISFHSKPGEGTTVTLVIS